MIFKTIVPLVLLSSLQVYADAVPKRDADSSTKEQGSQRSPESIAKQKNLHGSNLCRKHEVKIFACNLSGGGVVSVCGSENLSGSTGALYYRFRRTGQTEIQIPSDTPPSANPLDAVRLISKSFEWGSGGYLRFHNGQKDYVVYDYFIGGLGNRSGLRVLNADAKGEDINKRPLLSKACLKQESAASRINYDFLVDVDLEEDEKQLSAPFLD